MAKRRKLSEDQPQDNNDNINDSSDDTFGLPEIEYEPLKREEETPVEEEADPISSESHTYTQEPSQEESEPSYVSNYPPEEERYVPDYSEPDEGSSAWPKILGIAALLLIVGAGAWYFGYYKPEQDEREKIEHERMAREEAERKRHEEELAELRRQEAEKRKADSLANLKPAIGTVETLSSPSGRYYVIVASGVDGDLIMDYAKKLSPKGVSSKVIPPHGKVKFYRLAVAEGDTYTSTQTTADEMKADYPDGAWVIKY